MSPLLLNRLCNLLKYSVSAFILSRYDSSNSVVQITFSAEELLHQYSREMFPSKMLFEQSQPIRWQRVGSVHAKLPSPSGFPLIIKSSCTYTGFAITSYRTSHLVLHFYPFLLIPRRKFTLLSSHYTSLATEARTDVTQKLWGSIMMPGDGSWLRSAV